MIIVLVYYVVFVLAKVCRNYIRCSFWKTFVWLNYVNYMIFSSVFAKSGKLLNFDALFCFPKKKMSFFVLLALMFQLLLVEREKNI